VAWRTQGLERLERHLPALADGYALPIAAAQALDLDVVNLGPWGRDAHTMFERVHVPFAFERLPRLIERLVRDVGRG
jgi:arginine utilization protein RocB